MEALGVTLNAAWAHMLDNYPRALVLGGGTVMAHTGVWLLFNVPYTLALVLKIPFFEKHRIQNVRGVFSWISLPTWD